MDEETKVPEAPIEAEAQAPQEAEISPVEAPTSDETPEVAPDATEAPADAS